MPAADDRSPAALKERPPAPQHRRCAEDQLHPDEQARGDHCIKGARGRDDVERGIGPELFAALGAAEKIAVAGMLGAVPSFGRIDGHRGEALPAQLGEEAFDRVEPGSRGRDEVKALHPRPRRMPLLNAKSACV